MASVAADRSIDSILEILPGIGAIESSQFQFRDIHRRYHACIDSNAAVILLLDTLVVRQTAAFMAEVKLERFVTPGIH